MKLYRFLDQEFALKSLREQRLRISRLHELNDPFEWASPGTSDAYHRRIFEQTKLKASEHSGIICFSRHWRNPLLWSHYADKHGGMALGFDVPRELLTVVNYRKSRLDCDWNRFYKSEEYALRMMEMVLSTKSDHWAYEEEARLHLSFNEKPDHRGNFFADFGEKLRLSEVVVGHNCSCKRDELTKLTDGSATKVKLTKARLAFRSFEVVRQRNQKIW